MDKSKKIYFVVAGGGHDTDKHYHDTIEQKRAFREIAHFLAEDEKVVLEKKYHGGPFTAWGAVPGSGNARYWAIMKPGDYVLIYRKGKIIFAAEVAIKLHNQNLAKFIFPLR